MTKITATAIELHTRGRFCVCGRQDSLSGPWVLAPVSPCFTGNQGVSRDSTHEATNAAALLSFSLRRLWNRVLPFATRKCATERCSSDTSIVIIGFPFGLRRVSWLLYQMDVQDNVRYCSLFASDDLSVGPRRAPKYDRLPCLAQ